MNSRTLTDEEVSFLQHEFTLADSNTDGKINPTELMAVCARMGSPIDTLAETESLVRDLVSGAQTGKMSLNKKEILEINFQQLLTLFKKIRAAGGVKLQTARTGPSPLTTAQGASRPILDFTRNLERTSTPGEKTARGLPSARRSIEDPSPALKAIAQVELSLDQLLDVLFGGETGDPFMKKLMAFQFDVQELFKSLQTVLPEKSESGQSIENLLATIQTTKNLFSTPQERTYLNLELSITDIYTQTREALPRLLEILSSQAAKMLTGPNKALFLSLSSAFIPVTRRVASEAAAYRKKAIQGEALSIAAKEDIQGASPDDLIEKKKAELQRISSELEVNRTQLELEKSKLFKFNPERDSEMVSILCTEIFEKQTELVNLREEIARSEHERQKLNTEYQEELKEYDRNIVSKQKALQSLSDAMSEMINHVETTTHLSAEEILTPRESDKPSRDPVTSVSRRQQTKDWNEVLEEKKRNENLLRMEKEYALKLEIISAKEQELESQLSKASNETAKARVKLSEAESMVRANNEQKQIAKEKEERYVQLTKILEKDRKEVEERALATEKKEAELQLTLHQYQLDSQQIEEKTRTLKDTEAAYEAKVIADNAARAKLQKESAEVAEQTKQVKERSDALHEREIAFEATLEQQTAELQAKLDAFALREKSLQFQEATQNEKFKELDEKEKQVQEDITSLQEQLQKREQEQKLAAQSLAEEKKTFQEEHTRKQNDLEALSQKLNAKAEKNKKQKQTLLEQIEKEEDAIEKKQQELAQRFKEVESQQKELQRLISFEEAKLSEEMAEKLEALAQVNAEIDSKSEIIHNLDANTKRVEKMEIALDEAKKKLKKDIAAFEEQKESFAQQEQLLTEKEAAIQETSQNLTKEYESKLAAIESREQALKKAMEDLDNEKMDHQTSLNAANDRKKKIRRREAESREKVALALSNLKIEEERVKTETEGLQAKLKDYNERAAALKQLESKYAHKDEDIRQQQKQIETLSALIEEKESKYMQALAEMRKDKENQTQHLNAKLVELNKQKLALKRSKKEFSFAKQQNKRLFENNQREVERIEQEREKFENYRLEKEAEIEQSQETLALVEAENKQLKAMMLEEENKNFAARKSHQDALEKEREAFKQEKLMVQEKYNYVIQIESTIQLKMDELATNTKLLEEKETKLSEQKKKLKAQLKQNKSELKQKDAKLKTLKSDLDAKNAQLENSQKELDNRANSLEEERLRLASRFDEIQKTISELLDIHGGPVDLSASQKRIKTLDSQIKGEHDELAKLELFSQALLAKDREVEKKFKEIQDLKNTLETQTLTGKATLEEELKHLKTKQIEIEEKAKEFEEKKANFKSEKLHVREARAKAKSDRKKEIEEQISLLIEHQSKNRAVIEELKFKEDEIRQAREEANTKISQIQGIERMVQERVELMTKNLQLKAKSLATCGEKFKEQEKKLRAYEVSVNTERKHIRLENAKESAKIRERESQLEAQSQEIKKMETKAEELKELAAKEFKRIEKERIAFEADKTEYQQQLKDEHEVLQQRISEYKENKNQLQEEKSKLQEKEDQLQQKLSQIKEAEITVQAKAVLQTQKLNRTIESAEKEKERLKEELRELDQERKILKKTSDQLMQREAQFAAKEVELEDFRSKLEEQRERNKAMRVRLLEAKQQQLRDSEVEQERIEKMKQEVQNWAHRQQLATQRPRGLSSFQSQTQLPTALISSKGSSKSFSPQTSVAPVIDEVFYQNFSDVLASQRILRKWLVRKRYSPIDMKAVNSVNNFFVTRKTRNRNMVLEEILVSERAYQTALHASLNKIVKPARVHGILFVGSDLEIFFSDFEIIADLSSILLSQIEKVLGRWPSESCLGKIFLSNIPLFKLYIRYIRSHNKSGGKIVKLSGSQGFLDWAKTADIKESEFKVFGSPVKRLKEYERLLKSLLSFQHQEHVEYPILEAAVRGMTNFNTMLDSNDDLTKVKPRTLSVETLQHKKIKATEVLGSLKVTIIAAHNLPMTLKRLPSTYVEVRFNKTSWATAVVKKEVSPVWKETFLLPVPTHFKTTSATTLSVEVFHTNLVGKEEIGSLTFLIEDLIVKQSSVSKIYSLSLAIKGKQQKEKDKDKEKEKGKKQEASPGLEIQFEFISN